MIILVLAVIWIVALAPFALRRLSEHQVALSVDRFRQLTGRFGQRHREARVAEPLRQPVRNLHASPEDERRAAKARLHARNERRRRALVVLLGVGAFTLSFGAIPSLHVLWDLTIVDVLLTAAYVGALVYLKRLEVFEAERRAAVRNIMQLDARGDARQRLAGVAGGGATFPVASAFRPAFRIVEAPR
jgi:hypothetical protein